MSFERSKQQLLHISTSGLLSEIGKERDKVCVSRRLVTRQENSVLERVWSEYWGGTASGRLAFLSLSLRKKDKVKTLQNKATIPGIVKRWLNHKKKTHIWGTQSKGHCTHSRCATSPRGLWELWVFAAPLSSQTARKSDLLTIAWSKAGLDISVTGLIFIYLASIWLFFQPVLTFVSGDTIRPRPIAVHTCY